MTEGAENPARIALIVAMSRNGVIGRNNGMPWHLPEELRHFKATTMGKPMVMGRKTWESIGRALPGRTSIVVTRRRQWQPEGAIVVASVDEALERGRAIAGEGGEVMVIGGGEIYRQALPLSDRLYITEVDMEVAGDTFFPAIEPGQWRQVSLEPDFGKIRVPLPGESTRACVINAPVVTQGNRVAG